MARSTFGVSGKLQYLKPDPGLFAYEKPYQSVIPFSSPDARATNLTLSAHDVVIQDIRGQADRFTLDSAGFEVHTHSSNVNFGSKEDIESRHLPEMEKYLTEALGARKVVIWNHQVLH